MRIDYMEESVVTSASGAQRTFACLLAMSGLRQIPSLTIFFFPVVMDRLPEHIYTSNSDVLNWY